MFLVRVVPLKVLFVWRVQEGTARNTSQLMTGQERGGEGEKEIDEIEREGGRERGRDGREREIREGCKRRDGIVCPNHCKHLPLANPLENGKASP